MTQTPEPAQQRGTRFSGLALSSLVLGIIGVCGSIVPILNNLTAIAALVGVVLGIIALFGTRKVMAGIGTGLGVLALVATVAVQGMLVNAINEAGSPGGESSSSERPTPESSADSSSGSSTELDFGEKHTWPGGETISISEPGPYTANNQFLQPQQGKRYVQFDVHVVNDGNDEYNVGSVTITAQHGGKVAQQSYAAGDQFPNSELPPGDEVSYTMVFEIPEEPGELQVSVQPNAFAADTVYFTGKV
ncbi:DUF4190 domain-containing protein [Actinopolyspora mortivallis]|uniref:DUF4352 domain-containing protein n=1 Tax=Actinopolyspora mortivallis TaxID=33906 RepID=A0A2T0H1J7_ACTMO|nr:DUF4190 domain-containing protein [Actinopolyspora mortivallis]PRW65222.1 hypothetical protein CEP50_01460 [Actinopolyspora mortivallis]